MKKFIVIFILVIGISNIFSQDLSGYFIRRTDEIYFHKKGIATEKRTYRIVNLDDGGIGLIEDVENLSSPMFSIINGYAVYSDRIELTFIKSPFRESIVNEIILKQPGE